MSARASISVTAPAKINLHLGVHAETDGRGYHRVDSVMTAISLADTISIAPSECLTVRATPAVDAPMEQNTAYRAAVAMGAAFGREASFSIEIQKRIPLKSGLGGPSADAAATMVGICRIWGIDPTDPRVVEAARSIGADVPFFLYGPPAYLAGAGDVLKETFEPLPEMPLAIVKPAAGGVAARDAYARFDADPQAPGRLEDMLAALRSGDADAVVAHISNNLAPAACDLMPEIAEVRSWLRGQDGVRVAEVSGSGSAVFAVCASDGAAQAVARAAGTGRGWWSCAANMKKSGPSVKVL